MLWVSPMGTQSCCQNLLPQGGCCSQQETMWSCCCQWGFARSGVVVTAVGGCGGCWGVPVLGTAAPSHGGIGYHWLLSPHGTQRIVTGIKRLEFSKAKHGWFYSSVTSAVSGAELPEVAERRGATPNPLSHPGDTMAPQHPQAVPSSPGLWQHLWAVRTWLSTLSWLCQPWWHPGVLYTAPCAHCAPHWGPRGWVGYKDHPLVVHRESGAAGGHHAGDRGVPTGPGGAGMGGMAGSPRHPRGTRGFITSGMLSPRGYSCGGYLPSPPAGMSLLV